MYFERTSKVTNIIGDNNFGNSSRGQVWYWYDFRSLGKTFTQSQYLLPDFVIGRDPKMSISFRSKGFLTMSFTIEALLCFLKGFLDEQ